MDYDEEKTMRGIKEALELTVQEVSDGDPDEIRYAVANAIATFLNYISEFEDPYLEFKDGKMVYIGGFKVLALKIKEAANGEKLSSRSDG